MIPVHCEDKKIGFLTREQTGRMSRTIRLKLIRDGEIDPFATPLRHAPWGTEIVLTLEEAHEFVTAMEIHTREACTDEIIRERGIPEGYRVLEDPCYAGFRVTWLVVNVDLATSEILFDHDEFAPFEVDTHLLKPSAAAVTTEAWKPEPWAKSDAETAIERATRSVRKKMGEDFEKALLGAVTTSTVETGPLTVDKVEGMGVTSKKEARARAAADLREALSADKMVEIFDEHGKLIDRFGMSEIFDEHGKLIDRFGMSESYEDWSKRKHAGPRAPKLPTPVYMGVDWSTPTVTSGTIIRPITL